MPKLSMNSFHSLEAAESRRLLLRRFPWMKKHTRLLDQALELQNSMTPRPDGYFQWHLPRIVCTIERLFIPACRSFLKPRILVIGSWPAFSQLFREVLAKENIDAELVTTSLDGEPEFFECRSRKIAATTEKLIIGRDVFPWTDASFDIIVFTEMIEHLIDHPQYALAEMNRILGDQGKIIVTTPNVVSWKKMYAASRGKWDYDSPTFGGNWGHRYEYSNYQLHSMLEACGFTPVVRETWDVYFDDPTGGRQCFQKWALMTAKLLTGDLRSFAKMFKASGSTLFFLYQKKHPIANSMEMVRI